MRAILLISMLSVAMHGHAQYSYFNNTYLPPDFENQNGSAMWNLFSFDTILYCAGGAFSEGSFGHYVIRADDETGSIIDDTFSPFYDITAYFTWNDTYAVHEDGSIEGVLPTSNNDLTLPSLYRFRFDETGTVTFENFNDDVVTDSTAAYPKVVRLIDADNLAITGVYDVHTFDGDITEGVFLQHSNPDGSETSTFLYPLYNEQWQDTIAHYTLWVTDMMLLPNDEVLIAGDWFRSDSEGVGRAVPFFLKINSNNEISGHFKFGNEEIDNYYTWVLPAEDDKVLFAYGHGTQLDDISGYAFFDQRIGLFDPMTMDTLWTRSYGYNGMGWRTQDFEQTSDGGYALLMVNSNEDEVLVASILKLDSLFDEEWFKEYLPPFLSYDCTLYDLEVTADGGMAAVGNIIATDELFYRTWLIKLDACGDLEWSGCPFTGVDENQSTTFKVYPNPFSSLLLLSVPAGIVHIVIRDVMGRTVFELAATPRMTLQLGNLSSGIYLLEAINGDGSVYSTKILKE